MLQKAPPRPEIIWDDLRVSMSRNYAQMWGLLFEQELGRLPEFVHSPCCAEFVVSSERVRRHPRQFYVSLLDWLRHTSNDRFWAGRIFECECSNTCRGRRVGFGIGPGMQKQQMSGAGSGKAAVFLHASAVSTAISNGCTHKASKVACSCVAMRSQADVVVSAYSSWHLILHACVSLASDAGKDLTWLCCGRCLAHHVWRGPCIHCTPQV